MRTEAATADRSTSEGYESQPKGLGGIESSKSKTVQYSVQQGELNCTSWYKFKMHALSAAEATMVQTVDERKRYSQRNYISSSFGTV